MLNSMSVNVCHHYKNWATESIQTNGLQVNIRHVVSGASVYCTVNWNTYSILCDTALLRL